GIGLAKMLDLFEHETCAPDLGGERGIRWQEAAWEDVLLDEIRILPVGLEALLLDRDDLEQRGTATLEATVKRVEITWPIGLADCPEHFERHDAVVAALDVAIILDAQVDVIGLAGLLGDALGPGELRRGQRDTGHLSVRFNREMLGERAPAAAYFQN